MVKEVELNEDILEVIRKTWGKVDENLLNRSSKFALYINNEFIGMYFLINFYGSTILTDLYIMEHHRKKGYSKILLDDAKRRVTEANLLPLWLFTKLDNFYDKFGFEKSDRLIAIGEQTYVYKG